MSLLGRIARHPHSPMRNAAEDRLTEIFAALIDHPHCQGLGCWLVASWLDGALTGPDETERRRLAELRDAIRDGQWVCRVRTQFFAQSGSRRRRPDLEISLRSDVGREIVVWVEVKHGSGPHSLQLFDYLDAVGDHDAFLALLAPRAEYTGFVRTEIPQQVLRLTWQKTAAILTHYIPDTAIERFLIDELLSYLREERLMDPKRVMPEHLVALAYHEEAQEALALVWEYADDYVNLHWTPHGSDHTNKGYGETRHRYPSHPSGARALQLYDQFGWSVFRDGARYFRNGRRGVPRLVAGASGDEPAARSIGAAAEDQLRRHGFAILVPKDETWTGQGVRLWRLAYPDEVLSGSTIAEQGEAVGRWIIESFTRLYETLAPLDGQLQTQT